MEAGNLETIFSANLAQLRKGMAQAEKELQAFNKRVGQNSVPVGPFSSGGSSPKTPSASNSPMHNMPSSDAPAKYAKSLDDLRAKYSPLFAVQRQYDANLQEINRALQIGAINQEEYNSAVMMAGYTYKVQNAGIEATQVAMGKMANSAQLSTHQIANLQYQFQDLGVMMASGQNPFVMIMQQGSQIVQLFRPGTGIGAALKQIGSGFITFLLNPLNLALFALASATIAIPALWNAVTGSVEKTNGVLEDHNEWLGTILVGYEDIKTAANDAFASAAKLPIEIARLEVGKGVADLKGELEGLDAFIKGFKVRDDAFIPLDNINEGLEAIRGFKAQLDSGEISAEKFAEAMRLIQMNPNANAEVRKIATTLADAILQQMKLNNQFEAANRLLEAMGPAAQRAAAQVNLLSQSFALLQSMGQDGQLVGPMDTITAISNQVDALKDKIPEARTQLQVMKDDLNAILNNPLATDAQKNAANEAFQQFATNTKIIEDRANSLKGADASLKQAAQNQIFLADLQREVDILGMGTQEREKMLRVLEQEREVRSAIEQLGPNAAAAEIALVQQLIPLRMELNEQIRLEQEQIQNQISLYGEYGNAIGSALGTLISGSEDAERALAKMVLQLIQATIQAQIMNTIGQSQPAIGSLFNNIIGGIFGGARANGGPVEPGKMYLVNEDTPNSEFFMPTQPGMIIPNRGGLAPASSQGGGQINVTARMAVENGNLVPLITEVSGMVAGQQIKQSENNIGTTMMKQRLNRRPGIR